MRTAMSRAPSAALTMLVTLALAGMLLAPAALAGEYRERSKVQRRTNVTRVNHDVRRVDLNDRISDLVRRHSMKMAERGKLFHTVDPARTYLDGIAWSRWGENVGYTDGTVADMHQAFMVSPLHRANILDGRYRRVAIGAVRVDGTLWVTVFFWG